jgi:hypothetical protein
MMKQKEAAGVKICPPVARCANWIVEILGSGGGEQSGRLRSSDVHPRRVADQPVTIIVTSAVFTLESSQDSNNN